MELKQLANDFLFSLGAAGRAQRTLEDYRKPLGHFTKYARDQRWPMDANRVTSAHIRQFLVWVGTRTGEYAAGNGSVRHYKPTQSTPFSYYKSVRRLFNWAFENNLVSPNPMAGVHFKAPPQAEILPYSTGEVKAVAAVCRSAIKGDAHFLGLRNRALLMVFVDSATRLKETWGLDVTDVNLEEGYVRIIGKGNRLSISPFCPDTRKALEAYLSERMSRAKTTRLWITEDGTPLTYAGIVSAFKKLKSRAGVVSPGGVHRLRHTAALAFLRATNNAFLLQQFLRHRDLAMTRRYVHGLEKQEAILAHRNGGSPVQNLGI